MRSWVRPYADALVAAARSTDEVQEVHAELVEFERLMDEMPALTRLAESPVVAVEAKVDALKAIAERAGAHPITRRLLCGLARRHRLHRLDDVVAGIGEVVNERLGIVEAEVVSATPLADDERRRLESILERRLDSRVRMTTRIEEDLIAGFVVRAGSLRYDASLRGQLSRLTDRMTDPAAAGT